MTFHIILKKKNDKGEFETLIDEELDEAEGNIKYDLREVRNPKYWGIQKREHSGGLDLQIKGHRLEDTLTKTKRRK